MTDISDTVLAKSDQLNADDLIGGPITIKITRVNKVKDEQPIVIYYENDGGKPYKPGKSMRRVLIALYGKNSDAYLGKILVLYRDPRVKFGKLEVGGIRISHASDIDGEQRIVITVKQGQKGEFVVKPFRQQQQQRAPTEAEARETIANGTIEDLRALFRAAKNEPWWSNVDADFKKRGAELSPPKQETNDDGRSDTAALGNDGPDTSSSGPDGYDGV